MKTLFRNIIILSCLVLSGLSLKAQGLKLVKEKKIRPFTHLSVDRYRNIYLADKNGNITKYNENGDSLQTFSPQKIATISLLEAWQMVKVFVFYRDFQEYIFLNRFLVAETPFKIDDMEIGFVRVATMSYDNSIWAFDDTDFSLKKYNPQTKTLLVNTPCDLLLNPQEYNITFIKEYQNQVYLYDENSGLLIFDNLGNYKKKMYLDLMIKFGFWEDWLYILQKNELTLQNLYNLEQHKFNLPIEQLYENVVYFGDKVVLFSNNKMYFFEMN